MMKLTLRKAKEQDLNRCFEIESVSYAGDEAATKEKILTRIQTYPEGFVVLENELEIIGFINSGATDDVQLSDEEFKELIGHDANGRCIVIMSVVVHPDYQGQSMASVLMKHFIKDMQDLGKMEIFLICQTELIGLYKKFGFVLLGKSDSDHGGLSWYEMSLRL